MKKVILTLLVCGLVLLAFSATASAATKARPFQGYVCGTITFDPTDSPPPDPPFLWVFSNAVGDVSHMGASTLWSRHAAGYAFSGEMTLTAANGDTVTGTYVGEGDIPLDIQTGEWYAVSSDHTITGGTGRFAGATGQFHTVGSLQFMGFDAPVWPAIWSWTGTISY
jgi:hypothetical protein